MTLHPELEALVEAVARILCAIDGKDPDQKSGRKIATWDGPRHPQQWEDPEFTGQARAVLSVISPLIEAKDAEIARLTADAELHVRTLVDELTIAQAEAGEAILRAEADRQTALELAGRHTAEVEALKVELARTRKALDDATVEHAEFVLSVEQVHAERDALEARAVSAEAALATSRAVLLDVLHWGDARCPMRDDDPRACPLCGASVANLEPCKSAERTFPPDLLSRIRSLKEKPHADE